MRPATSLQFSALLLLHTLAVDPALAQQRYEFSEVHMGVPVRIVLFAATDLAARKAARSAFERIAVLDERLSDYREQSELRRIEALAGNWVPISHETFEVLARALLVARASDGAFDPTIGPLVQLWRESRHTGRLPARPSVDSARTRIGHQHLALDSTRRAARLARSGMKLDLGGIAKGYILQEAMVALQRNGVTQALIEAGGDVVVGAAPPGRPGWTIDAPGADAALTGRASSLVNAALATSGTTMQFVEIDGTRYAHLVDPKTGLGLTEARIAYVIARDAAIADALATALAILGPRLSAQLLSHFPDLHWSLASCC